MSIAFFGSNGSFDYHQIGGTDSLARRLAVELIHMGEEVRFIHFNCVNERAESTPEGISLFYFVRLDDALRYMGGRFSHVFSIYVPPKYRPTWLWFRKNESFRTHFHKLYATWSESWLKRTIGFAEAMVIPYNGTLFCVSPRLKRSVSKLSNRSQLLIPPVPDNYFLCPDEKPMSNRLRITYMGRIDLNKGVRVAIDLFRFLAKKAPDIKTRICGFSWKHKMETVKIHHELLRQDVINYEHAEYENYFEAVGDSVRRILKETDILFLPYIKLSSTIDTPLLMLEGMANLCAIVTRPLGSLPEIYGTNEFMLEDISDQESCLRLFRLIWSRINVEHRRLAIRCKELEFSASEVANAISLMLNGKNFVS